MSPGRRAFERAAATYESADALHREVGRRLVEHLDPIRVDPARVLDLGCGTGSQLDALARRFPGAQVVGLDFSPAMLRRALARVPWWRRALGVRPARFACADLQSLPLAAASAGLAFSNLALQWCDARAVFSEAARVLVKDGLLLFSTLGPDTLRELRHAFGAAPFPGFVDMHDLGDALVAAGFGQPVMEMELLTLEYSTLDALLADLHRVGALGAAAPSAGLGGRGRREAAARAYEARRRDGALPATYEVVYGHAWKAGARLAADGRQVIDFVRAPRP